MTSRSDLADLLWPGASVPVNAETTSRLLNALRESQAYTSQKHYSQAFPKAVTAKAGMTLRDYFAAKAMQGMMAMPWPDMEDDAPKFLAKTAYGIADAMLEARYDTDISS